MRLLSVKTYRVHEFFGSDIPVYAVLSHTWGSIEDEVSFQDICNLTPSIRQKPGFGKIVYTVEQARKDNINWVWVDTCCIDKTSSAELSEAINSMYNWYKRSMFCYAYLSDVSSALSAAPRDVWESEDFAKSRWFTRGWTLQELIAPRSVFFFTREWVLINSKAEHFSLANPDHAAWMHRLVAITGIPLELLFGHKSKTEYSVAQRMFWAANRACTRIEDVAYSLLGLFDINMPLLYGEEDKAFERLQEEILKTMDDHTLFATVPEFQRVDPFMSQIVTSVFARSPRDFCQSSDVVRTTEEMGEPSQMTKHGLRIQLPVRKIRFPNQHHLFWRPGRFETYLGALNCNIDGKPVHVLLLRDNAALETWEGRSYPKRYYRLWTPRVVGELPPGVTASAETQIELIYVRRTVPAGLLNHYAPSIRLINFRTNLWTIPTFIWGHETPPDSYEVVEKHQSPDSSWSNTLDRFLSTAVYSVTMRAVLRLAHSGRPEMPPIFLLAMTQWGVPWDKVVVALFRGTGNHPEDFASLHRLCYETAESSWAVLSPGISLETSLRLGDGKYIQARTHLSRGLDDDSAWGTSKHILISINTWVAERDITAQEPTPTLTLGDMKGSFGTPVGLR